MQRRILNISMPGRLYREVENMAKREAKTKAELVREILRKHVEAKKIWGEIRAWGSESANKFGVKKEEDVDRVIHESRMP